MGAVAKAHVDQSGSLLVYDVETDEFRPLTAEDHNATWNEAHCRADFIRARGLLDDFREFRKGWSAP